LRDKKGTIQPAPGGDNKPVAPPDLWEKLDALRPKAPTRPKGGFTFTEFQRKFGLTEGKTRVELKNMMRGGKLVKQGVYYLIP
jgi:hypothetical protein